MIFLSEANVNTLISGLLVLAGVGIAPLIAFFTAKYNRTHDEKSHKRNLLKPSIEDIIQYMTDILNKTIFLYNKCNGKTLDEIDKEYSIGEVKSEFPLNYIFSLESDCNKLQKILVDGIVRLPKRLLSYSLKHLTLSIEFTTYLNDGIIIDNKVINLDKYVSYNKRIRKLYGKTINVARRYLRVN